MMNLSFFFLSSRLSWKGRRVGEQGRFPPINRDVWESIFSSINLQSSHTRFKSLPFYSWVFPDQQSSNLCTADFGSSIASLSLSVLMFIMIYMWGGSGDVVDRR